MFTHDFIIHYYKNSKLGYALTFDTHYSEYLQLLQRDLPYFTPKNSN